MSARKAHTVLSLWEKPRCGTGSRFVRRKVREHPAKMVRKAEARYTKYTADYHFHTAAQEHPELTKNALTRYWQKQRLRRQYRKQAKEAAKQGVAAAGKTATATERLTARAVEFVKSHPAGAVVAVLCVLLLFAMQSCSSTMLMLGNAGAGALGASTYPCEDRDMLPPKLPTVRWKMICSTIWTPMKAPMTMTNTTSIWMKSNMIPMCCFLFCVRSMRGNGQ